MTEPVSKGTSEWDKRGKTERVTADHPFKGGRFKREFTLKCGQRDVDDGDIELVLISAES